MQDQAHLAVPLLPKGAPPGCYFDHDAADAAAAFFPNYLRHTEGEWAGQPFVLRDWQRDEVIRPFFGWKRADGLRLYRRCYLEVPKKNGKTELSAGVALLALMGDGEINAPVFAIAVDRDQAKLVFDKAQIMVGFSPELSRRLECMTTSIYCPELLSSIKPLSKTPGGKHGLSTKALIGDECHAWPSGELYDICHKGAAARTQPIEFLITTAGIKGVGFGWELHETARQVRDGVLEDPELLVVIYAAPEDAEVDDPEAWAAANPNLGISPKLDFIRAEAKKAKQTPSAENDFRRFHLDQWVEQITRWISVPDWRKSDAGVVPWDDLPELLAGRPCFGGLDLSSTTDLTALGLVFPPVADDAQSRWAMIWDFWIPNGAVKKMRPELERNFRQWADLGALTIVDGNVIDYDAINTRIIEHVATTYAVKGLAIDRWNATQLALDLIKDGAPVTFFGQGYQSMSNPSKEFERLVLARSIDHGGHPVAAHNVANLAIEKDAPGNIKPAKHKASGRIDGIVASIMGLGLATGQKKKKRVTYTAGQMYR